MAKENPYTPHPALITGSISLTPTERLYEIRFLDRRLHDDFAFEPGQFVQLTVYGVGEAPISISSSPTRRGFLELCVRSVGRVTSALHRLGRGDLVGIRGPFGHGFPHEQMRNHDVLVVAGGLGLDPLRSLVDLIHDERYLYGDVTIVYGAKTPKDVLFRYEFDLWQERDDFNLHVIVEEPDDSWKGDVGMVTHVLDRVPMDIGQTYAAICGPAAMYGPVIDVLFERGLRAENVFLSFERRMKCGVGHCGHCAIGPKQLCLHGPVLTYYEARELPEAFA